MPTLGYGTTLSWNGSVVGDIDTFTLPQMTASAVDVTTHQSADGYMEFIQGLVDAGTVSLAGKFKPSDETDRN